MIFEVIERIGNEIKTLARFNSVDVALDFLTLYKKSNENKKVFLVKGEK